MEQKNPPVVRTLSSELNSKVGKAVYLEGWAHSIRDHGKLAFIDLRDRKGLTQVVAAGDVYKSIKNLSAESVIEVYGKVKKRDSKYINPNVVSGKVEVEAEKINVLNKSVELPFDITRDTKDINENTRFRYRYLDLRSERLQRNMRLRSEFIQKAREFLFKNDFVEIETPILSKTTPEGSRDFVVPSRMYPGKFYALPQSPQQYKQLLMVAGFERYFQVARAIRDEDLRADRGFEHTQIDLEVSFVNRDSIMQIVEDLIIYTVENMGYKIKAKPFPKITYKESIEKYGSDKFDLRTEEEKQQGILAYAWVVDFPFFEKTDEGNWTFTHNPFSSPIAEHKEWHLKGENIDKILTAQYDLVCNGYESGGGSVRAHEPEVLRATYKIMGYGDEQIENSIGHMLKAFEYGAPPHGGIALGVERNVMNLSSEEFLREVQAFPMTARGRTSVMEAPSPITQEQLDELGLQVKESDLFEDIKRYLGERKIEYEVTEHEPVFTSAEAAKARGLKEEKEGAKALIFKGKEHIMFVVRGNDKVDMKKARQIAQTGDLPMATPEQVLNSTGVEIGAVPPFGFLRDIKTYVDEKVFESEYTYFNPGRHDKTIKIRSDDYKKLGEIIIGSYAKS